MLENLDPDPASVNTDLKHWSWVRILKRIKTGYKGLYFFLNVSLIFLNLFSMTFDMDSCYKFSSASLNFFFPFYVLVLSLIEVFHSLCCFFCFRFLRNHCRMIAARILRDVFSSLAHSCPSCSLLRCPLLVMSLLLAFQIWQCPWVTRRTTCFFPRL